MAYIFISRCRFAMIFIFIINSYDIFNLFFNTIGIDSNLFLFLVAFSFTIRNFISHDTIGLKSYFAYVLLTFFILCNFVFGISNGFNLSSILSSTSGFLCLINLHFYFSKSTSSRLIFDLYKLTVLSIALIIFVDIFNLIFGGGSLTIIAQNNMALLLFSFLILNFLGCEYGISDNKITFLRFLFSLYLIESVLSFYLSPSYVRLQYKSLVMSFFILFILFFLFYKSWVTLSFKTIKMLSLMIFVFLNGTFIILFFVIYNYAMHFIPRLGSGIVRLEVAKAIYNEVYNSNILTGFGSGASESIFYIEYFGVIKEYSSHSGFMSFLYEFGLIGFALIFCYLIACITFKFCGVPSPNIISKSFRFPIGMSMLLLVFTWVFFNVVYISAIPNAASYFFFQTPIYILLIHFLSNSFYQARG